MRIPVRYPVFFETPDQKGDGTLREVSYSGARVEVGDLRLTRGERVRLYVWPRRQSEPFELAGSVASVHGDGFAVEFEGVGQEICQWIDALLASAGEEPVKDRSEGAA